MGLAVAYQLSRAGVQTTLYEADDRVGGMAATQLFGPDEMERFYHFYCLDDSDLSRVLDELGLTDRLKWVNTKMGYWHDGRLQQRGTMSSLLRFRGLSVTSKIRYGLHAAIAVRRAEWKSLEGKDAATWLRAWVGEAAYSVLWKKLFDFKFYELTNDVSATWIWRRIRRIGRSRRGLFRETLGYLEGGTSILLEEIAGDIETNGGVIRLREPVIRMVHDANDQWNITTLNRSENFRYVVSTVPLPLLPSICESLSEDAVKKIESIRNIGVVCVKVRLTKKFTPYFWLNVSDDEMEIPGLVEFSNLRPLSNGVVFVPYYLPQEHPKFSESDEFFITEVTNYMTKINPTLQRDDFLQFAVSRYRYAQPVCQPYFEKMLPEIENSAPGLWVADTSHYYPEDRGLSESIGFGRRLADLVLRELSQEPKE